MKVAIWIVFVLMCVAQWYVPGSVIAEHENLLSHGRAYKFLTQPLDPNDPFRGKYITLRFKEQRFNVEGRTWRPGAKMFAIIEEDHDGFARITDVVDTPPVDLDYMPVTVTYGDESGVNLEFPFDRLFLEESKAPEFERQFFESVSDTTRHTYAVVRIKDGIAALQEVVAE